MIITGFAGRALEQSRIGERERFPGPQEKPPVFLDRGASSASIDAVFRQATAGTPQEPRPPGSQFGMLFRPLLATVVSATLVALPSLSAPQSAAVAGPSKSALVRGSQMTQGTNVFNGDIVEVAQDGDSVLLLGQNASIHLAGDSAVRFFRCGDTSTVQLLRGQMNFRSTPQRPVQVQLGDATIQPTAGQTVIGGIALTSPTTATLSAQQGSFTVTAAHEGKSVLVNPGESRLATLTTPANQASPNPPLCGVAAAVPSNGVSTAWVMIGLGAAGLATGLALSSHQTSLSCPQKGPLVSPYTFPCQ